MFLNTRCHSRLLSRSGNRYDRNLRWPFSQSVDLYWGIIQRQKELYTEGLGLTASQVWADKCPHCFGPSEDEVKASADEPQTIVAMDGNFQHRHNSYASKDTPQDDDYPEIFLPPSKIHTSERIFKSTETQAKGVKVCDID